MQNTITSVLGFLMLFSSIPRQEPPHKLQGGGHVLGESAEHFFSAGAVGEAFAESSAADRLRRDVRGALAARTDA